MNFKKVTEADIRRWGRKRKANREIYGVYAEYKQQADQLRDDSTKGFAYIELAARRDLKRMHIVELMAREGSEDEISKIKRKAQSIQRKRA